MVDIDASVNNQSALAKLLCGNIVASGGEIYEVLSYLSTSIDNVVNELETLESMSSNQISLYAPFLGRSILELGCTALIARLDPFRVLLLRKHQMQPDYDRSKSNKSSIRWQGDVLADKVANLWSDKSLQNHTRGLLGDYYKDVIWEPNFNNLLDSIQDVNGDIWIEDLRQKTFERFYNESLNDFSSLYSELSKGIHHELVIPLSSTFDQETTRELIKKTVRNIANFGLFVSVLSHTLNKLDVEEAIATYKEIQEMGVF
jgi:hypothetical protein